MKPQFKGKSTQANPIQLSIQSFIFIYNSKKQKHGDQNKYPSHPNKRNYQEMEDDEYGERENGSDASTDQLWPTCDDDYGIVRDGDDRTDDEDHEVT